MKLYFGDVLDETFLRALIRNTCPDELYHLAAQSSVAISFANPEYSTEVNALGTLRILEALKEFSDTKRVKFYNVYYPLLIWDTSK
jgi:GDPmannose 4,6-dehydratase